jgi:hypothetical protein
VGAERERRGKKRRKEKKRKEKKRGNCRKEKGSPCKSNNTTD